MFMIMTDLLTNDTDDTHDNDYLNFKKLFSNIHEDDLI